MLGGVSETQAQSGQALIDAAQKGQLEEVKKLLADRGQFIPDNYKCLAFLYAAKCGQNAVVIELLTQARNSISDEEIGWALNSVIRHEHLLVLQTLLPYVQDGLKNVLSEHLKEAAKVGNSKVVKEILSQKGNLISYTDKFYILYEGCRGNGIDASNNDYAEVVKEVLVHAGNLFSATDKGIALYVACKSGNLLAIDELLKLQGHTISDADKINAYISSASTSSKEFILYFVTYFHKICTVHFLSSWISIIKEDEYSIKRISSFFSRCSFFGVPLSSMIVKPNHFQTYQSKKEFLLSSDPIAYLESHDCCTKVTIAALRILEKAEDIKKQESQTQAIRNFNETAMDDNEVRRVRWHFEHKIIPYIVKNEVVMNAKSSDDFIETIEKQIRAFILDHLYKDAIEKIEIAVLSKNGETEKYGKIIEFIENNKDVLVAGYDKAMEASTKIFTENNALHAAWRGYNPYAPTNEWPNLLALSKTHVDDIAFTSKASSNTALKESEASHIVRKWAAYFYLVLQDTLTQFPENKDIAIANYFIRLQEIRNAHGVDDPSCFPGHLTRLCHIGDFHPNLMLPPSNKANIAKFFHIKVLSGFKSKLQKLKSDEKTMFLQGLIDLTELNATDIILHPEKYAKELLAFRQKFILSLGSVQDIVGELNKQGIYLEKNEIIYIQQHLLDVAPGNIAKALSACLQQETDRKPSMEELKNANPFKEEPKEREFSQLILDVVLENLPHYRNSWRSLQTFVDFLKAKVPSITENNNQMSFKDVKDLIDNGIEGEDEEKTNVKEQIRISMKKSQWNENTQNSKGKNPFAAELHNLNNQKQKMTGPLLTMFNKRIENTKRKANNFDVLYLGLQQFFEGIKLSQKEEFVERVARQLAEQRNHSVESILDDLCKEDKQILEPYLDKLKIVLGEGTNVDKENNPNNNKVNHKEGMEMDPKRMKRQ